MEQQHLRDIYSRITLFRSLSVFLNLFCVVQLIISVVLPDLLPRELKVWLVVIAGSAFVGITTGLFLARKDPSTSLFFTYLSAFISGLVSGISLVVIIVKVKN
jgi:hypothetical protein